MFVRESTKNRKGMASSSKDTRMEESTEEKGKHQARRNYPIKHLVLDFLRK